MRILIFYVSVGATFGFLVSVIIFFPFSNKILMPKRKEKSGFVGSERFYDTSLADQLFKEVRLLCWILTTPENHRTKAFHIKQTWGRRCNKLLFMSSEKDINLETIALPVAEGRDNLWDKTKRAFEFIHRNHFNDFDWFLKADDDSYVIPENLRFMLSQYQPQTALYIGSRFINNDAPEGYMAGGAYILSKKALEKLVTNVLQNETACSWSNDGSEDLEIGKCLAHSAIFVDERDENNQKRFFPVGVSYHFDSSEDKDFWYDRYQYYKSPQGGLNCCSEAPVAFHYVDPAGIYYREYLIMKVHPFGLQTFGKLPRKFLLDEIIDRSDVESLSPNFRVHETYHKIEDTEIYR